VSLTSILYHAYALGLLPTTTKYGKIIHHQTFIYHQTIFNILRSLTKWSHFCVIGHANWKVQMFFEHQKQRNNTKKK
jgi:hypothetical protein